MIVQLSGVNDESQSLSSFVPTLLPNADPITNAVVVGALAWFLFSMLKHKVKEKRVHRLRSHAKSIQSRLRSAEGRLTKRGSRRAF